jgi:hypothetical protein
MFELIEALSMESLGLWLDHYESEHRKMWCWKYATDSEEWASEEYTSKALALKALRARKLEFSALDNYDPYEATLVGAKVNFEQDPPFDYWLVDSRQVYEPKCGGKLLGELPQFVLLQTAKVLRVTLSQFKHMVFLNEIRELEAEEPGPADC